METPGRRSSYPEDAAGEEQVGDGLDVCGEPARLLDRHVARAWQVDREDAVDPARSRGHDNDPVRQEHGFRDRVGDEDHGLPPLEPQPFDVEAHLLPRERVQGPERLVHQEERRVVDQTPADRRSLTHPPRQLERVAVLETVEPHRGQERLRLGSERGDVQPPALDLEEDVPEDGPPVEQHRVLEDDADLGLWPGHPAPGDRDRPGRRGEQARDHQEQRALPAARGPEDRHELAFGHLQRHRVEGVHRPGAHRVRLGHAGDLDQWHTPARTGTVADVAPERTAAPGGAGPAGRGTERGRRAAGDGAPACPGFPGDRGSGIVSVRAGTRSCRTRSPAGSTRAPDTSSAARGSPASPPAARSQSSWPCWRR